MKFAYAAIVAVVALIAVSGFAAADRLPNQTPENQIFSIDKVIDVTGSVDEATQLAWVIANPGAIPTGILGARQSVADVTYTDSILTNGGKLSENKNFDFDSQDKGKGLYNIESTKVLTYASTEGAHLTGEEYILLDVAGNWSSTADSIRCVFASAKSAYIPAFCNAVSAKSSLINVNSAQISTKAQVRAVAKTSDSPAELNYQIAVTPDSNSGSGFAEGTVKTEFAGSIMEARDANDYPADATGSAAVAAGVQGANWNKTSATNQWKDTTEVTGGIKNLQKTFAYKSGFRL
ncbi:MAG TPA: hypothetical protein VN372_11400 [Methanospirillum sp.]|nr:hypothetical protein [Methanospirillum sp.]